MKTELQERADVLVCNLQRSVNVCFEVLQSISQLFASSSRVGRQDFERFVQPMLSRHQSIHALEWLPRLADCDRDTFEQSVHAEGYASFQITEQSADGDIIRAKARPEYFPVYYVEPLANNQLALGFDLASDATRRLALEKARDTGAIAVSGRIELVQEEQRQFGVLVILPIYRGGAVLEPLSSRREHLQGFVLGVFRIADIVQGALSGLNLENIDFFLHDRSDHPNDGLLATYEASTQLVAACSPSTPSDAVTDAVIVGGLEDASSPRSASGSPTGSTSPANAPSGKQGSPERAICIRSFEVADRQWSVLLLPTPSYIDRAEMFQQSQMWADAAAAEATKLKQVLLNLQQTQARWFLEKKLITVGVGLVLCILSGASLISYRNVIELIESTDEMGNTYASLTSLSRIRSETTDPGTTSSKASWLSGSPASAGASSSDTNLLNANLPPLQHELAMLQQILMQRVAQGTAASSNLQQQLGQLDALIEQWTRLVQPQQDQRSRLNADAIAPPSPASRQLQRQIHQLLLTMEQQERSRLLYWHGQADANVQRIFSIHGIGISLSIALLVGIYYLLQRQMTERQQVESALFQANNQLEIEVQEREAELAQTRELNDLKLRLFSMVSHEFRTPLSTILISTQLLASSNPDCPEEKRIKNLSRIQSAAKTMAQLLSDILTLNRAEAGKLEFRPESFDLEVFCSQLVEDIQLHSGTDHPIHFKCHCLSPQVCLDSKLLNSILTNLLSNAVKYSPSGSPVQLTVTRIPGHIVFRVQDQGVGILPEDQKHLYEAFYRGQNVGDVVGSGLGLAIVKTCVDLHGGQIVAESEIGQGSTFIVTLPQ